MSKNASAQHSGDISEVTQHSNTKPRAWRSTIVAFVALVVGLLAYQNTSTQWWGILCVFGAALIVGETLELRLVDRPPVPVSFAAIMAIARTSTNGGVFSWAHISIVLCAAALISSLCFVQVSVVGRIKYFVARASVYFVGTVMARVLFDRVVADSQWRYAIIIGSLITMLAIHEVFAWLDGYPQAYGVFAAAAHASVIAGGVLIGIGYAGDDVVTVAQRAENLDTAGNGLGISALLMCSIPVLVAWFAFSRYYGALRTYRQTIRALSAAPELGGIVAWGHADRVARLALAVADKLDLDREDRQAIETAAYMHTLGDAVLDTSMEVDIAEEAEAAHVTADIVRASGGLDRVADIIDDHVRPYRGIVDGELVAQNDIAASVLRVANDYDNISRRDESWGARALTTMITSSSATYNPRALEALEWVLTRDKYADLIEPPEMPDRIKEHLNS